MQDTLSASLNSDALSLRGVDMMQRYGISYVKILTNVNEINH